MDQTDVQPRWAGAMVLPLEGGKAEKTYTEEQYKEWAARICRPEGYETLENDQRLRHARVLWEALMRSCSIGIAVLRPYDTIRGLLRLLEQAHPDIYRKLGDSGQRDLLMSRVPPPPPLVLAIASHMPKPGVWLQGLETSSLEATLKKVATRTRAMKPPEPKPVNDPMPAWKPKVVKAVASAREANLDSQIAALLKVAEAKAEATDGEVNINIAYADAPALWMWLNMQRYKKSKGQLSEARVVKLSKAGVTWQVEKKPRKKGPASPKIGAAVRKRFRRKWEDELEAYLKLAKAVRRRNILPTDNLERWKWLDLQRRKKAAGLLDLACEERLVAEGISLERPAKPVIPVRGIKAPYKRQLKPRVELTPWLTSWKSLTSQR